MTHRLLVFGDSWAYGAELDPDEREQDNFAGQLGKMLGVSSVHNCAESGSSITHMHPQFQNALTRMSYDPADTYTAVFFLTGQSRHLFFDVDKEFAFLNPRGPSVRPCQHSKQDLFFEINDYYYKYIQSDQADVLSVNTNLLALQARCKYHGIDDYYISGWETLDLWPEVDSGKVWKQGQSHCAELFGVTKNGADILDFERNQYIRPHGTHPTQQGHKLIAQTLYNFIKQLDTAI